MGDGVRKDIDEAINWSRKAAEQGHAKAKVNYELYLEYKGRERESREAKKNGGCFITSAVCDSLGKPDDCDELMTMRRYRDELKAEDKDMTSLIEEYYRVAPLVVQRIDKSNEAKRIYNDLWKTSISKIYENIKQGNPQKAKLQYVDMLEKLCIRYNVAFAPGIVTTIEKERNQ